MTPQFQWEDARYFLAVARVGQLKKAAAMLGVSTITLSRHLAQLQRRAQSPLFYRHSQGLRLTDEGSRLMVHLERIEAEFEVASDVVFGSRTNSVVGTVRIAAPEGFALKVLSEHLVDLADSAPDLRVEVVPQHPGFSLSRRDADLAIMIERPRERSLQAESLGRYQLGLFASPIYVERFGIPTSVEELKSHRLIGYVEDILVTQSLNLSATVWSGWESHYGLYSPVAQVAAVRSGLGIAVLHEFLLDAEDSLVRLLPDIRLDREFFVVTHQATARIPRIQAVMAFLKTLRPMLERDSQRVPDAFSADLA